MIIDKRRKKAEKQRGKIKCFALITEDKRQMKAKMEREKRKKKDKIKRQKKKIKR